MTTRRIRLDIQYDGTDFAGWQVQPGVRTVQGELADALKTIVGTEVVVTGSGRTDAGVHARGQVAHVDIPIESPEVHRITDGLNALTGRDVAVMKVTDVADDFHARFNARRRTYIYRIARHPLALERNWVWYCRSRLDYAAMVDAVPALIGRYEATSWCASRAVDPDAIVSVEFAELRDVPYGLEFEIRADRFVMHMVRAIVGTLVEVGRGKRRPDSIAELIRARRRELAGETAPPIGLCLERVEYDEDAESKQ